MNLFKTPETSLEEVFRQIGSGGIPPVVENFDRGKTIFFSR